VKDRKHKILLIQGIIFFIALGLIYNTYIDKNKVIENNIEKIETQLDPAKNSFEDVEYTGFDLDGNRYSIKAEQADFTTAFPELINMKKMVAYFYFKDNTVLNNVRADYLSSFTLSDKLNYSSARSKLTITGNVRGESIQGDIIADNVEYDLTTKIIDFSMFDKNKVNVKLK
jgi:hypothetical protein